MDPPPSVFDFPCILPNAGISRLNLLGAEHIRVSQQEFLNGRPRYGDIAPDNARHIELHQARHHVIPFSVFRTLLITVNTIIAQNEPTAREVRGRVEEMLTVMANEYSRTINAHVDIPVNNGIMSGGTMFQNPRVVNRMITRTVNWRAGSRGEVVETANLAIDMEILFNSLISWLPGNLFVGWQPNLRTDDPGDGFEINSRYIFNDEYHFGILVNLYNEIQRYVRGRQLADLDLIIANIRTLSRYQLQPFRADQWNDEAGDRHSIRVPQDNQFLPPVLEPRARGAGQRRNRRPRRDGSSILEGDDSDERAMCYPADLFRAMALIERKIETNICNGSSSLDFDDHWIDRRKVTNYKNELEKFNDREETYVCKAWFGAIDGDWAVGVTESAKISAPGKCYPYQRSAGISDFRVLKKIPGMKTNWDDRWIPIASITSVDQLQKSHRRFICTAYKSNSDTWVVGFTESTTKTEIPTRCYVHYGEERTHDFFVLRKLTCFQ